MYILPGFVMLMASGWKSVPLPYGDVYNLFKFNQCVEVDLFYLCQFYSRLLNK